MWGPFESNLIEKVHIGFLKEILGVRKSTTNSFIYGELGEFPIEIEKNVRIIKYWLKLVRPHEINSKGTYVRALYGEMMGSLESGSICGNEWAKYVKNMLERNGFGNIWIDQQVRNEKVFIEEFRQRLQDCFTQKWRASLNESTDNRLYKHIKEEFQYEMYLSFIGYSKFRIALTRIRLSSHCFMVERGRWKRPRMDFEQRLCSHCKVIEDEYHCLVECIRYSDIRGKYLCRHLKKRPNVLKFIELLKCSENTDINKLSILCHKILVKYREFYM